jgi:hypothetical protein
MPIKSSGMGNFYPLKTRVFSAVRPLVQNIAEMTNFRFLEPPEFIVHIYYDLIFLILISKSNQLFRGFIIKKGEFTETSMYS